MAGEKGLRVRKNDVISELPELVETEFKARKVAGDSIEIVFGSGRQNGNYSKEGETPYWVNRNVGRKKTWSAKFPEVEVVLIPEGNRFWDKIGDFVLDKENAMRVYSGKNLDWCDCRSDNTFKNLPEFRDFLYSSLKDADIGLWRRAYFEGDCGGGDWYAQGKYPYKKIGLTENSDTDTFLKSAAKSVVDVVAFGRGMKSVGENGKKAAEELINLDTNYRSLIGEIKYHKECLEGSDNVKGLRPAKKELETYGYEKVDEVLSSGGTEELGSLRGLTGSRFNTQVFGYLLQEIDYSQRVLSGLEKGLADRKKELTLQAYRNVFEGGTA